MKSWKTSYTALLIAQTIAMAGFGISFPIIPLFLEEEIGITDPVQLKTWVGIIQSSGAITLAIFAPIWGHLADIFSRRAMLLRAMFGGAVVITLMSLVTSPWQFLLLRTLQGCLTGTVAAATVLTASISPAAQVAFTLGILQTGIAVGNSLGPLFGGIMSDFIGRRTAFFITGMALALAGLIVLIWVESDRRSADLRSDDSKSGEIPDANAKKKRLSLFPDFRPIAASPVLVTLMLATFFNYASNSAASPMLPIFLKELAMKASPEPEFIGSATGIVMGVGAAFTAIAAVLVGKFSSNFGYWKTLVFCLAAGALFTVPQTFVTSMAQLTVLRAMSSFFTGGAAPVINAIIAVSSDKKHQGTIYGINASVGSAGSAIGPIIGSASAILNNRAVFTAAAVLLGFSAWRTARRYKLNG